jgi:hypothetical protein
VKRPFVRFRGIAAPLPLSNVNTDAIIPSSYLRSETSDLARGLFGRLRFDEAGNERSEFVLNHETYRNAEILNRINEVSFNSSLMREMRAIAFVTSLVQRGKLAPDEMKEMYVHSIRSDETMSELGVSSKLNADWDFLCFLRDRGREEAEAWLAASFDDVGARSSVDIRAAFL